MWHYPTFVQHIKLAPYAKFHAWLQLGRDLLPIPLTIIGKGKEAEKEKKKEEEEEEEEETEKKKKGKKKTGIMTFFLRRLAGFMVI